MDHIYLDNCATTTIDPAVVDAMVECERAGYGNPASQHEPGRRARRKLEDAREAILALVGAAPDDQLIFTSGGTEANNLALRGLTSARDGVVVSTIEHPSVLQTADFLSSQGHDVRQLPVDSSGIVLCSELPSMLDERSRLVSVMVGNHETGVLQPLPQIVEFCRQHAVLLHTDAVQVIGKMPFHFRKSGVDATSIAAHKFHGPLGIGALVCRSDVKLTPLLYGGFQQSSIRAGTESVTLAVGMLRALQLCTADIDQRTAHMTALRDCFEQQLAADIPGLVIHGASSPRLPHIASISFPNVDRQAMLMALDLSGVACATGSACASGSSEPSPVLRAMGLSDDLIRGSLRFSFSALTRASEAAEAAARIIRVHNDLRR